MMRIYVYDKKQISALKTYKKKDSFKALSSNINSRNSSYILFKHIFDSLKDSKFITVISIQRLKKKNPMSPLLSKLNISINYLCPWELP